MCIYWYPTPRLNLLQKPLAPVPRKMVKFNPGFSPIWSRVFLSIIRTCNSSSKNTVKPLYSDTRHDYTSWRNWPIRSITRVSNTINWLDTTHFDSEDDYRTGCRNVSHCQQQQSYSGLRSPGRSNSTYFWSDSWVQTFHRKQNNTNFKNVLSPGVFWKRFSRLNYIYNPGQNLLRMFLP